MREEIRRILQMVQEGKISAADAAELIEAFEVGEAADAEEPRTTPPPPPGAPKDPFKSFVETIERIGKEATENVNWQDVAKQVREGAAKGVEHLKTGFEQVSKGKVNIPWLSNQETREVTLPLTIPSGKTLKIDNSCGSVKIVGGFETGTVTASARFRAGSVEEAKKKAEEYTLLIEESDHMVLIRQPDVSGLQVDVQVQMQGKGAVEVRCNSGDVTLMDTGGSARVDCLEGNIRLKGLNGPVEVSASAGNIEAEDVVTPSLTIENKHGHLTLRRVNGNINARTANGNVILEECSGKTMAIDSATGDISADICDPVSGTVNVRTVNGNAKVTVLDGGDCRVSLSTLRGTVTCDLPLEDEASNAQRVTGRLGDGSGTLDVSSVTGNIAASIRSQPCK